MHVLVILFPEAKNKLSQEMCHYSLQDDFFLGPSLVLYLNFWQRHQ